MVASIVACGESARKWSDVPCDFSVGVNDCFKWGSQVDYLVLVNSPFKFYPNQANSKVNRLDTIVKTKPKMVYCHNSNWKAYFQNIELLALKTFYGKYSTNRIYSSKTSPIVAITLAASKGAKKIILWGVDFITHHEFKPGKKEFDLEINQYIRLFDSLAENGISCYLGNENSTLKAYLPVYVG